MALNKRRPGILEREILSPENEMISLKAPAVHENKLGVNANIMTLVAQKKLINSVFLKYL